jgi:hypothetical protein
MKCLVWNCDRNVNDEDNAPHLCLKHLREQREEDEVLEWQKARLNDLSKLWG